MTNGLISILPSAVILGFAGMIALILGISRGWASESMIKIPGAVRVAMIAILCQTAHFTEELITGFHERFPALFGLAPMSLRFFVVFNIGCLVIWALSSWGLASRHRAALFPLWFLGIGCAMNGVAHPLLSVLAGGYFPGLVSSPVVGVLGIFLLGRLHAITRSVDSSPRAA